MKLNPSLLISPSLTNEIFLRLLMQGVLISRRLSQSSSVCNGNPPHHVRNVNDFYSFISFVLFFVT